jgi:cytochrome P450
MPATVSGSFLEEDPPDHGRLRRVVAPAFRPRAVRSWAPRVEAVLHDLLDRLERTGRLRDGFDVMADLAAPFPIAVVSTVLGVPEADAARFREIGAIAGKALDGVRSLREADRLRAVGLELEEMFTRILDQRAADPRDDVLSVLAAARAEGTVGVAEALETAGLLLIAGFETTVNLIGNGIAALHAHPDRWAELVADPALAPAVVEETLRWDPSVQGTTRLAHADTTLAGTPVRAGATLLVLTAAANRDPAAHPDPAVFDPHRTGEPDHLTFSSGIHYCLGAPLARLEGEVAFRVLAARLPDLRLPAGARRRPGAIIRGYASLPARA